MSVNLQDLRRYAIENRVEIKFEAAGYSACLITVKGQIKIPGDDKDLRIESVIGSADSFEITVDGKPKGYSRDAMAQILKDATKKRGVAVHVKEEE